MSPADRARSAARLARLLAAQERRARAEAVALAASMRALNEAGTSGSSSALAERGLAAYLDERAEVMRRSARTRLRVLATRHGAALERLTDVRRTARAAGVLEERCAGEALRAVERRLENELADRLGRRAVQERLENSP